MLSIQQGYYFFSINRAMAAKPIWRDGTVYVFSREPFKRLDTRCVHFDEWACQEMVQPLIRIAVSPRDFMFVDRIARHPENEPMIWSWLNYKRRVREH